MIKPVNDVKDEDFSRFQIETGKLYQASLVLKHVKPKTTIMTDGWAAYTALGKHDFKHCVVNHKRGFREQGRGNEHVCKCFDAYLNDC